ncbi:MAG: hypothetical protein LBC30_03060 [Puniceicoccales bacterium]|jgi:hypothetical protein|nr:hypothetical protein [Puniceicoccales bacterium]
MDTYIDYAGAAQMPEAYHGGQGHFGMPEETTWGLVPEIPLETHSPLEGIILEPAARGQLEGLRRQAIAYENEARTSGRALEEREVTLLLRGQVMNGQLVVEEVEARNRLDSFQATAVRGSNWTKIFVSSLGIILGIVLQLKGSEYDAAAYGVAVALFASAMENFFIDRIKRPDPALRGQYQP